jgi:hypothetical protein
MRVHLWLDNSLFLAHSTLPDRHRSADQSSLRLLPCNSVSSVVDRFSIFSGRFPVRRSAAICTHQRINPTAWASSIWCRIPVSPDTGARTARLGVPDTHGRRTRPRTGTLQQGLDGKEAPDAMLRASPSVTDGCLRSPRGRCGFGDFSLRVRRFVYLDVDRDGIPPRPLTQGDAPWIVAKCSGC